MTRVARSRRHNPEGRMTALDHLRELRRRLIITLIIITAGAIAGWYLYDPVLRLLERPYCNVDPRYRFAGGDGSCVLVYHGVLDGFHMRLKVAFATGAALTAPLWLYQVWAFITPGLRKKERRFTVAFVLASTLLFALGAVLAYLVLERGLSFLLGQAGPNVVALLTVNSYLSFVLKMLIAFGVAFELPLIVVLANLAGVLPARALRKSQRVAIFLIFVFAAVATPSADPFSMCAMAVPMVALFEAAVLIATVHDKRKAQQRIARHAVEDAADRELSPIS
jgi:sec-independent protein translocase protein TatC